MIDSVGDDKEIELKSLEIQTDKGGSYVFYQAMSGEYGNVSLDHLHHFRYRPDKLRALLYQIITDNGDMLDLKQSIGEVLARAEDALLNEFFRDNPQFRRIEDD